MRSAALCCLAAVICLSCGDSGRRPSGTLPTNNNSANNNNTSNNNSSGAPVQVQVRSFTRPYQAEGITPPAGQQHIYIEADVINAESTPLLVRWRGFSLQTDSGVHPVSELTAQLSDTCNYELDGRGRKFCSLYFQVAAGATPQTLIFRTPAGDVHGAIDASRGPPALCAQPGPELDLAACSDGCNNDGDAFTDCEDSDCCDVLSSCAPGTFCGGAAVECVMGEEGSIASCNDGCDNDGNSYTDCNDFGCCDVRSCQADTSCFSRPDLFALPLAFNEGAISAVDASSLPAGPTPCHAPVLVYVTQVRDGDTFVVEAITGDVSGPVRLIGVDTPEIGRDGAPSECYGEEAGAWMQQVTGRSLWLTFDSECTDRFDRNLAYAYYGSRRTELLQRHLLRRGYARRFPFSGNDGLAELLDNDEQIARAAGVGLWTACP